jgi:hypothetical protein
VRWKAAGVLVKLGPVALEPLEKALRETGDPNLRQGGEWAARKIKEQRAKIRERSPSPSGNPPER